MIPQLLLEEILLGEKNEKDYYQLYGKDELTKALDQLRESDEEIIKTYPVDLAEDKYFKALLKKRTTSRAGKTVYTLVKFSAAAILVLAFAFPVLLKGKEHTVPVSDGIRIKGNGSNKIRLYCQEGKDVVQLKNGELAEENDLIQITYVPGLYDYGIIFSVDGNGNITRHFPEQGWEAAKLEKTGEEVPLPFSYSLDNAPDYECFIFAASNKSFNLSDIENIEKDTLTLSYLEKASYLPEGCSSAVFTLRKNN
ncbi:hypothetical protein [Treponema sp.]|uniref:hypothetical protein n=1 Tax=Treponema sp. TaxID=166 RepID=UPI0025E95269|nr:hypothetical protein [Treponema sp.]MCR5217087.1 hypothetical protein [Treponema sp.]